jgi:hypothetical protein
MKTQAMARKKGPENRYFGAKNFFVSGQRLRQIFSKTDFEFKLSIDQFQNFGIEF